MTTQVMVMVMPNETHQVHVHVGSRDQHGHFVHGDNPTPIKPGTTRTFFVHVGAQLLVHEGPQE